MTPNHTAIVILGVNTGEDDIILDTLHSMKTRAFAKYGEYTKDKMSDIAMICDHKLYREQTSADA